MSRIPRHPGGRKQNFDRPDVAGAASATAGENDSFLYWEPSSILSSVIFAVKQKTPRPAIEPQSFNLCYPGRYELLPSNSVPQALSLASPGKLVGRTGRGTAAADLRPAGMRLGQCRGESDAAAGDLRALAVCHRERRCDGD